MDGNSCPVGERLKRARTEMNLTLKKLSRASGVPPSTIWKYENEDVDYSFLTIVKLAEALGRSVGYFLGLENPDQGHLVAANPDEGVSCWMDSQGWRFDLFNRRLTGRWLINGILHLQPGARFNPVRLLENEVCLHCSRGPIGVEHGRAVYQLAAGDSLQFRTDAPVTIWNQAEGEARAVMAATRFPFLI